MLIFPYLLQVTHLDMESQPQLFAICIGFDRTADFGISQLREEEVEEKVTSSSGVSSQNYANGLHPLTKHSATFASHSSGSVDSGTSPYGTKVARFSIGGGTGTGNNTTAGGFVSGLRECDSDSAVDFMIGRPSSDDYNPNPVIFINK